MTMYLVLKFFIFWLCYLPGLRNSSIVYFQIKICLRKVEKEEEEETYYWGLESWNKAKAHKEPRLITELVSFPF